MHSRAVRASTLRAHARGVALAKGSRMFSTSSSPLRHTLVAALLASSTLSAGCYRTVLVAPSELPRLVAAQAEDAPDLEVIDVDGDKQTIRAPVEQITLVPIDPGRIFMQAPEIAWAASATRSTQRALGAAGWLEADVTVRRPFSATVGPHAVGLAQLSSEGVGPRAILVPAKYVRGVEVQEFNEGATVGLTLGIIVGIAGIVVGSFLGSCAVSGGCMP
jgi:hypothetical protein